MPVAQGLVYPGTDLRMMTRSIDAYAQGFYLTRENIAWFQDQYVPDAATRLDPRASPLSIENDLSNAICRSFGFALLGVGDTEFAGRTFGTNHWMISL